jgi:hypothetical protein
MPDLDPAPILDALASDPRLLVGRDDGTGAATEDRRQPLKW